MQVLEYAYLRRKKVEAQLQAVAIVEILAQVLLGGGAGAHGLTTDGKVIKEITSEQGLAKIGVFL